MWLTKMHITDIICILDNHMLHQIKFGCRRSMFQYLLIPKVHREPWNILSHKVVRRLKGITMGLLYPFLEALWNLNVWSQRKLLRFEILNPSIMNAQEPWIQLNYIPTAAFCIRSGRGGSKVTWCWFCSYMWGWKGNTLSIILTLLRICSRFHVSNGSIQLLIHIYSYLGNEFSHQHPCYNVLSVSLSPPAFHSGPSPGQ